MTSPFIRSARNSPAESGFTPKNLFDSDEESSSSSSSSRDSEDTTAYFHPTAGEDELDDRLELEEDDICNGTKTITLVDKDGVEREEVIDEPQKKADFEKAKAKMEKEKKQLIQSKRKVVVEVKTKEEYEIDGRVEGRASSDFSGSKGTIVDVLPDKRYTIEWDDGVTCEMKKSKLKLAKEPPQKFKWVVVEDHIAENPPSSYGECGLIGFDFNDFREINNKVSDGYNNPFGRLVEELWPGSWREQLKTLNAAIEVWNEDPANRKKKSVNPVSDDEWWVFWGVVLVAAPAGKGGISALYDTGSQILKELPQVNLKDVMKKYRAQEILRHISKAFHGEDESYPWNPIASLIDGFNNNRARKIAASHKKVPDEAMSSYDPTSTKYGGLKFLSFILRKPKPLGTEFKVMSCSETGKRTYIYYITY
jgi:hypothetical protein